MEETMDVRFDENTHNFLVLYPKEELEIAVEFMARVVKKTPEDENLSGMLKIMLVALEQEKRVAWFNYVQREGLLQ